MATVIPNAKNFWPFSNSSFCQTQNLEIQKNLFWNKCRIAVEFAFGMSNIHSLGMNHSFLKLCNNMMNSVFDSKIIDFGLIHDSDMSVTGSNLTKKVNEKEYNSKKSMREKIHAG
ncbi:hypothetical protein M9Y10_030689 [Tritrichomonas musculus]|uniref:Protein kinase domain-containing protein n=1 Tax=Tritrichomonas musculus TaxID=1915356 RepID=A0ABR2H2Q8_9EUKA